MSDQTFTGTNLKSPGISVEVSHAGKIVGRGSHSRRILDDISMSLQAGEFVGVLGTSGSGKSTLIKTLAGLTTLTEGNICVDGEPVTTEELRHDRRIAYLPQDVIVHEPLTSTEALGYIAGLKGVLLPGSDPHDLVQAALKRVGLADRSEVPIRNLSGGQRKRVALAAELLGEPQLILLDEATSGLDPATEAGMMDLFRSLADEGRTVVCITHFPGRLHLCDRLIYLMDGICIFDGTPEQMMAFFRVNCIEDIYGRLGDHSAARWREQFETDFPVGPRPPICLNPADDLQARRGGQRSFNNQVTLLTSRFIRLQFADLHALGLQLIQAPIIALMVAVSFGNIRGSFAEQAAADTKLILFVLILAVLWCAGTASAREVVKELPVVRHERRFGVRLVAYLTSKLLWLGFVAIVQAAMLLFIVRYFTHLTGPPDLQFVILALTGLAGIALGLWISTMSGTSERAMTIVPVALIGLAIFSGGLARLVGIPLWMAKIASPAWWSLDGLKAPLPSTLRNATYPGGPGTFQPPILGAGGPIVLDTLVLLLQTAFLLLMALISLRITLFRFMR